MHAAKPTFARAPIAVLGGTFFPASMSEYLLIQACQPSYSCYDELFSYH
jgi:hypothetical protein